MGSRTPSNPCPKDDAYLRMWACGQSDKECKGHPLLDILSEQVVVCIEENRSDESLCEQIHLWLTGIANCPEFSPSQYRASGLPKRLGR